jgi:hypothetical protein
MLSSHCPLAGQVPILAIQARLSAKQQIEIIKLLFVISGVQEFITSLPKHQLIVNQFSIFHTRCSVFMLTQYTSRHH